MKIFHLSLREFETLNKDHADQLVFQERTYVKGDAFSERVYDRIIETLRSEGDDFTSCLVVDMEGGYFVWREIESPEGVEETSETELDQSEEIADLIAFSIDQTIEEILTHKQPITLEFLVDRLKNPELAQKIFAKLQEMGTTLQIAEFLEAATPPNPILQPRSPRRYRGVSY